MSPKRKVVVGTIAAVLALVAIGVSVWLVQRPRTPDCATVNEMLNYSQSENDRMRSLIPTNIDNPQKMIDAYQKREARMHQYAAQIHDNELREKAYAVVNLDDRMLDVWRQTILGQSPAKQRSDDSPGSQGFGRTYTDYAAQREKAAEALQAACPVSS